MHDRLRDVLRLQAAYAAYLAEPVHELHRTRGSFGYESRNNAIVTRGSVARIAPVIACGAALFALGLLARPRSNGTARRADY